MIGGRSALLSAAGGGNPYGDWTGDYEDVSLLLRNGSPLLAPIDESSTPKTVTTLGNAGFITNFLKYGSSSLRLAKSPDALSTPSLGLISTDFTIEFWIYLLDGGVASQIVCTTYNAPTQLNTFIISRSSPGNIITFIDPLGVGSTSTALPLATWTHIACVYIHSTRNYRIFVNGIGSTSATGTAITAEAANFFIGGSPGDNNLGTRYLSALIDDFRVTKLARYTSNFTPPSAELPANISDDPSYSSVPLLLRNGNPLSVIRVEPKDDSYAPKVLRPFGSISISSTVFKYGDGSILFDGSSSYAQVQPSAFVATNTESFTIEFWAYVTGSTTGCVISNWANDSFGFGIAVSSSAVDVNLSGNSIDMATTAPLLNAWNHVALSGTPGSLGLKLFLNGVQQGSTYTATVNLGSTTVLVTIGRLGNTATQYFNSYVDDLRITRGVVRYTKNFLPPPAELPAI